MFTQSGLRKAAIQTSRVLLMVLVTFLGLLLITFLIGRVVPIDPVLAVVGDKASAEVYERARIEMGLHLPLWKQFFIYLGRDPKLRATTVISGMCDPRRFRNLGTDGQSGYIGYSARLPRNHRVGFFCDLDRSFYRYSPGGYLGSKTRQPSGPYLPGRRPFRLLPADFLAGTDCSHGFLW